jgi:hypothetical protein
MENSEFSVCHQVSATMNNCFLFETCDLPLQRTLIDA